MKRTLLLIVSALTMPVISANAQTEYERNEDNGIKAFRNLDLAVTLGTTGVGVEAATQVNDMILLRTGFAFMPHFRQKMNFGIQVGDDEKQSASKFDKMSGMLEKLTGFEVNNSIDMIGRPTFYNFKFLVDVYPFRNKKWHFTTGFYLGSSQIADAYNTTEDMPSLMAVKMYNHLYDFMKDERYIDEPILGSSYIDPAMGDKFKDKLIGQGRMGINMGKYKDSDNHYFMEPDADGMVKAKVKANVFKPYLGFGYGSSIDRSRKYMISFDCGAMFWGGAPEIVTHDGTDLVHDVEKVRGKVGRYVDAIKVFKVYPVINLRIARNIF